MKRTAGKRRRPAVQITLGRAARLYGFVALLGIEPRQREEILQGLQIGLRTFYRELELLRRCGIKIRLKERLYTLTSTADEAEGRLPFPDPQLSFAEMSELAAGTSPAAKRLAEMLEQVVREGRPKPPLPAKKKPLRKAP
jgi:hypothetical protein